MAEPGACPEWVASHEDQCGTFKAVPSVADIEACKALCGE